MSDLTRCNFCTLKSIRADARKKKLKVTILSDAKWGMGGVNVYVHPKNIKIRDLPGGEDGEREKYRKAWFMELTNHCCC